MFFYGMVNYLKLVTIKVIFNLQKQKMLCKVFSLTTTINIFC